jgi:pimeloyl-ACP methyl ester carboxylesterase
MLQQTVPLRPGRGDRLDWERVEAITAGYVRVGVPCLIVWGGRDETLPVSMGYKLAAELPDARLRIVQAGMHGLATERPRECVALIRGFLGAGPAYASSPRVARVDL